MNGIKAPQIPSAKTMMPLSAPVVRGSRSGWARRAGAVRVVPVAVAMSFAYPLRRAVNPLRRRQTVVQMTGFRD
jgi:hypothetical protein